MNGRCPPRLKTVHRCKFTRGPCSYGPPRHSERQQLRCATHLDAPRTWEGKGLSGNSFPPISGPRFGWKTCGRCRRRLLAPRAGFEPATIRLTVECSTAELPRNRRTKVRERGAYNKAFRPCKGPNDGLRRYLKRGLERATGICRRFLPRGRAVGTPPAQSRHLPASRIGPRI
jgi:hypothetical protein